MSAAEGADLKFLQARIAKLQQDAGRLNDTSALPGGGGGGIYDDMDPRVDALESRMDRFEGKLDRIGDGLADIRVELAKKPTTAGLWGMIATVIAVALAIAALSFAVAEWVATHSVPAP